MEKGFEQGRAEERLEMAKRLKALGVSENIIAKSTGLTVEEIMNL